MDWKLYMDWELYRLTLQEWWVLFALLGTSCIVAVTWYLKWWWCVFAGICTISGWAITMDLFEMRKWSTGQEVLVVLLGALWTLLLVSSVWSQVRTNKYSGTCALVAGFLLIVVSGIGRMLIRALDM